MAGFLVVTMSGCSLPREELKITDLQAYAEDKESRVVADQEPMQGGLTLSKAIARAIKYNLDVRVAEMDAGLKRGDLAMANYNLLPNLVASSGYDGRNNDLAADSRNIQTGQIELANAVSTDRNTLASGMGVSWNILDFSLSYVRGQQIADKALIAEEMRRKAVNRIVEDVRTAYWRALTADHLRGELRRLEAKAQQAMTDARALEASRPDIENHCAHLSARAIGNPGAIAQDRDGLRRRENAIGRFDEHAAGRGILARSRPFR